MEFNESFRANVMRIVSVLEFQIIEVIFVRNCCKDMQSHILSPTSARTSVLSPIKIETIPRNIARNFRAILSREG